MKLGQSIKEYVIPVISVITAFLVAWVNFQAQTNEQLIKEQQQVAEARSQEIKNSKQNCNFNYKKLIVKSKKVEKNEKSEKVTKNLT